MNAALEVALAGTRVLLLADRALYWPEEGCLLVADIHFGKAASFRRLGQPVPSGTTAANLRRLDNLLHEHGCRRLVFLGDFLHARQGAGRLWPALAAWRAGHPELSIDLVRGNTTAMPATRPPPSASPCTTSRWPSAPSPCSTSPSRTRRCTCWPATCTRPSACAEPVARACACPASTWAKT